MKRNYKLMAVIRFVTSAPIHHDDQITIENGATDKLKGELESFLKDRGIEIQITSDFGDIEENA